MKVQALHSGFIMPTKGTSDSGAFDIYMPEDGTAWGNAMLVGLGFAAEVPRGHVALILPRSGIGAKFGLELNNTCGVIDADYRGEWKAALRTKDGSHCYWKAGDRMLQFLIVPLTDVDLELVDVLGTTERGIRGFGSSGR